METEAIDWVALRLLGLRPVVAQQLISRLDWPLLLKEPLKLKALIAELAPRVNLPAYLPHLYEEAAKQLVHLEQLNATVVDYFDEHYPPLLKTIFDPPIALFCLGNRAILAEPQIAMVGSRKATSLAKATARQLARDLTSAGVHVTSGLAIGIDGAAHEGALNGGSGATLAVMANGLAQIYPQCHQRLASQIIEQGGLILTEHLPSVPPKPYQFPERNRIISGLSLGTVVVEAAIKSGSLVTAKTALEQGREVFAVPGALSNAGAKGCHLLIKQGAGLIEEANDILSALYLPLACAQSNASDPQPEEPLLAILGEAPMTIDQIATLLKVSVPDAQIKLIELELSGHIAREGAHFVRLK